MLGVSQCSWYGQVVIEPSQGRAEHLMLLEREVAIIAKRMRGNEHSASAT